MSMRTSILATVSVLAMSACNDGAQIFTETGRLLASPSLGDLGTVANGVPSFFLIDLSATIANVEVSDVSILNLDGDEFFSLQEFADDGGVLPEGYEAYLDSFTVEEGANVKLPIVYFPKVEGYHRARVTLTNNGRETEVVVNLRAQSDRPEASITPWTLDFGWVPRNSSEFAYVRIKNLSQLPLAITTAFAESSQFWTDEPQPKIIPPNSPEYEYRINLDSITDSLISESVSFLVGLETLRPVKLKANDCEGGVPSAYDKDGDGFSACFGDCNDDDRTVNPLAQERVNNLDDNCDGEADEGTNAYDDDGDGYCESTVGCNDGSLPGDCNDGDARMNPGEDEDCPGADPNCFDGIDNDCDGDVDGGSEDLDGDGYTLEAGDCEPTLPNVHPGHPELPDGEDNDCDGTTDEGTVLYDDDGDGFCEGLVGWFGAPCSNLSYIGTGDCDDSVNPNNVSDPFPGARIFPAFGGDPGGDESLDRFVDNDCDGYVDEDTIWGDDDGDGYTEEGGDCDDTTAAIGPHVFDNPNTPIDEDCDATTP